MFLSSPNLKRLTTLFFAVGILLLVGWPVLLGPKPPKGSRRTEYRAYIVRSGLYMSGLLIAALGSGIGAIVLFRRVTNEYAEQSIDNLKELIEGSVAAREKAKSEGDGNAG